MFRSRGFLIFLAVAAFIFLARDRIAVLMPQLPVNPRARTTDTRILAKTITPYTDQQRDLDRGIASGTDLGVSVASAPTVQRVVVPMPPPPASASAENTLVAQSVETATATTLYRVKPGDTLFSIAQRFGLDIDILTELNQISDPSQLHVDQDLIVPAPSPEPQTAPEGTRFYVVQGGDTLAGISRRLKVSISDLQRLNNLSDPNRLRVGQKLLVPNKATPASDSAVANVKNVDQSVAIAQGDSSEKPGQQQPPPTPTPHPHPTKGPVIPPPTSTPAPTPTPDLLAQPYCEVGREQVAVWGVHFCSPEDWAIAVEGGPERAMFASATTEQGESVLLAIIRPQAIPNAPLSVALRSAKEDVVQKVGAHIPEGLVQPEHWSDPQSLIIAGHESQAAEADTAYGLSGIPARVRVIVFNHLGQRWQIVMVAPQEKWRQYATNEFALMIRTLSVF